MQDELMEQEQAIRDYRATQRQIEIVHAATVTEEIRQQAREIADLFFPRKI